MKYGVSSDRSLMPAAVTLKYLTLLHKIGFSMTAFGTLKPIRSSEFVQIVKTIVLCLKPLLKLEEADFTVVTHAYLQYRVPPIILV